MRHIPFMPKSVLTTAIAAALVLAASSSALAATATFTSLANGRSVSGLQNGSPRSLGYAGTFNIQIDGVPPTREAYCVDINNGIGGGDVIPQAPVDYPGEVLFILNNAFPQANTIGVPLPAAADEAAAVQCAIWSYTDNMVCDTPSNVGARAAEIVAAANAAGPQSLGVVPQSFAMSPPSATNFLPGDTSHTVTATLRDGDGNALSGFTIGLSVISGPGTGNATSGPSPSQSLTYSNSIAGNDTIRATTTYTVPTGQKFKVAGKQGIVLAGQPTTGTITGTATKSWVTPQCGNGMVEGGEECDDGNQVNTDACTNACLNKRCGDGYVQSGEQCDDGNQNQNDACKNNCTNNVCGDQIVNPDTEECDDGNTVNNDGCTNLCKSPVCGDGIKQTGEQCDDGNQVNTDACTNACENARCGDGITGPGEQCDDGNQANNDTCTNACQNARCGDTIVGPGEQCDDGNQVNADGCSNACQLPACGDGIVQSGEQCDDGNQINGDACTNACQNARCGDGITGPGEQCDDGNLADGDGCSATCQLPYCGDGAVNQPSEQCDDGNNLSGDGCSPTCQLSEICTDQTDNDGDGRVDCDDTDCGCLVTVKACGHPCPARISFKPSAPDRLQFQVNVTPTQMIDPANVNVGIALTNANGIVYAAQLFPGDLKNQGKLWLFRDPTAVKSAGIRDGLQVVRVRTKDHVTYRFDVKANSDLLQQLATLPVMTIQLVVGSDAFEQTATWDPLRNGWKVNLQ